MLKMIPISERNLNHIIVSMKHSKFVKEQENSTNVDNFSKFSCTKNIPQIIFVKYCEKEEQIDTQRKTSYKI